jgi:hypothetical protein
MKTKQEKKPLGNADEQNSFVLIFNELAKEQAPDVSLEEIDAIEEVRRMVMEVTDDRPIFMTST